MTLGEYLDKIIAFLKDLFSLDEDRANEDETIIGIRRSVEFKGINVWILIFAVFIASIGLNLNSVAVIIGAMLISPLMGPIMGTGLALGIYDFELLAKSLKNLAIMVIVSLLASALYFAISPLHHAQSELIARTTPTIWDVFIGLFGGLSGIVAGSSKEKGNVVPGVAIATALMPPLCTAGYGLANLSSKFFFGGFYLFIINTMFIAITTYFVVRLLGFKKKKFLDQVKEKRVTLMVPIIGLLTIIPSIFLAINLVNQTVTDNNVNRFVNEAFDKSRNQVLSKEVIRSKTQEGADTLVVYLIGKPISNDELKYLKDDLKRYKLPYELKLNQDIVNNEKVDLLTLKQGVMKDLYQNNEAMLKIKNQQITDLQSKIEAMEEGRVDIAQLTKESLHWNPSIRSLAINHTESFDADSQEIDTIHIAFMTTSEAMDDQKRKEYEGWLKDRIPADSLIFKEIIK